MELSMELSQFQAKLGQRFELPGSAASIRLTLQEASALSAHALPGQAQAFSAALHRAR